MREQRQQEPRKFYTVEVNLLEPAALSSSSNRFTQAFGGHSIGITSRLLRRQHPEVAFVYGHYRMSRVKFTQIPARPNDPASSAEDFIGTKNLSLRITPLVL